MKTERMEKYVKVGGGGGGQNKENFKTDNILHQNQCIAYFHSMYFCRSSKCSRIGKENNIFKFLFKASNPSGCCVHPWHIKTFI